jgi:hypothetical protein
MTRRLALVALLLVAYPWARLSASPPSKSVLVLAGTADDARLELLRTTIGFWNGELRKLGLAPLLADPEVSVGSPITRTVENYAWQISRRAGRPPAGSFEPAPPSELIALEADVVVLLSAQKLMPFAWPLGATHRHLLAIAADLPGGDVQTRNVIAHELGHALGLVHNEDDPTALMCQPCAPPARGAEDGPTSFPPLTGAERSRLIELYRPLADDR